MVEYRIIRSRRKTLSLCVERDGSITVRAPLQLSADEITCFVSSHKGWIEQHTKRVLAANKERVRPAVGGTVMLLGKPYCIAVGEKSGVEKNVIRIGFGRALLEELARLFALEAKARLIPMTYAIAQREAIPVSSVRITGAQTRYGSCSARNGICLSWRIVSAPPELIEPVILHELCHVLHHDHSRAFWTEVYGRMPDYDEKKRALDSWARRWFFNEKELV